jgi:ATP-dependent Clp protease ATP-binding subunit ClpA
MFERFTDRARMVLTMAQDEARLLNHDFIGTEHILLGVVREGETAGSNVLSSLGLSLESVRNQVRATVGAGRASQKTSPPFTPRAKKALELSLRQALTLGHHYIGPEHIFLGLLREGEGVAVQVLTDVGVDLATARERVILAATSSADTGTGTDPTRETPVRSSSVRRTSHPPAASPQPRCPQCRGDLAGAARFRTIAVPPGNQEDPADADRGALAIYVVYCSSCGSSLHMFTRDSSE